MNKAHTKAQLFLMKPEVIYFFVIVTAIPTSNRSRVLI